MHILSNIFDDLVEFFSVSFLKKKRRFFYFKRRFRQIKNIHGDVVECGVGRGESMAFIVELAGSRKIWGFDSFEGFPEPSKYDTGKNAKKGEWGNISVEKIQNKYPRVKFVKGFFNDTLKDYNGDIAFLHLDADLYDSYLSALKVLYPKVVPGGIVLFDEYREQINKWPGAKKAIDEYFGESAKLIQKDKIGKYYIIKNRDV